MGPSLFQRCRDSCNHSVRAEPGHNINQKPRGSESERQLPRSFAPVTNCDGRWHSHPLQTNRGFRVVRLLAVGTVALLESCFHCIPQQPLGRLSECNTYPTPNLATILLAWNVRVHNLHVQCLPRMCTYKPHPRLFQRAHLQLPHQSADVGTSRRWIPGRQRI